MNEKEKKIQTLLEQHEQERQPALRYIALNGTQYNFDDWLTLSEYARQYELKSPNVLTNWIRRGIISPTDIIEVPELNGIRLVRNRAYKEATATEVASL